MKTPKYNKISTQGFSDRNGFGVTIKYEKEETKEVYEYDYPNEYTAEIRFYDLCKTGRNAFSITGHGSNDIGGAIGDELVMIDPFLKIFNDLHLCNVDGLCVGFAVNSFFCLERGSSNCLKDYGLNEEEVALVKHATSIEEFKFLIQEKTNFLERRKELAKQGLEKLKQLAGEHAKIKIKPDTTRPLFTPLAKEEVFEWEKKFENGYFKKECIDKRREKKKQDWVKREILKIENNFLKRQGELEAEKRILIEILKFSRKLYGSTAISHRSRVIDFSSQSWRKPTEEHEILNFINQTGNWINYWTIKNKGKLIKPRKNV